MKKIFKLTKFDLAVLEYLKKVPKGRVTTYAALAKAVGRPGAARAVGNALHKNPWAPRVPCHRVVCSDGRVGGYGGGAGKKVALLKKEGVFMRRGKVVGFAECLMTKL